MVTFRERVKEARIAAGMSQAELAAKVHIDQAVIWRIENRESPPWRTTIEKIGKVLPGILGGETIEQGQNGA